MHVFFTVVISSVFSSWVFNELRYKCGKYSVYFLVFDSLLSLLFHQQHSWTFYLFPGILSTVPQVPENWTKGKLLGAGAFGQVRCKLAWVSFKLCPVWSCECGYSHCKHWHYNLCEAAWAVGVACENSRFSSRWGRFAKRGHQRRGLLVG